VSADRPALSIPASETLLLKPVDSGRLSSGYGPRYNPIPSEDRCTGESTGPRRAARRRSADLTTLVEQTLAAYRVDRPEVVEVKGEPVALTPKQGLGLSLMLHELGTNAAKYGALSRDRGRLRVSWHVEEMSDRRLRLKWEERHGPRVKPPTEKGFGLQLIERAASFELEGAAELNFAPGGLACEVVFPLE
jgi:two-component system, chemotaxis family, CheB/CheR fusion protein